MIDNVDFEVLATIFVNKYVENKQTALQWANKEIPEEYNKYLRPIIREKLEAKGYKLL